MAAISSLSLPTFLSLLLLSNSATLNPSDYDSLSLIESNLGIPATHPPCTSAALTCSRRTATNSSSVLRITKLVFESQAITGVLSPAIGNLTELRELSLAGNSISGQIPPEIAGCRNLEILDFRSNEFTGEVPPEISSLTHLRVLDLSSNRFSGDLNFLNQLSSLEKLSLSGNLFSGRVPEFLHSFRNLQVIDLSCNSLLEGSERLPKRYVFTENPKVETQSSSIALAPLGSVKSPSPSPSPATKAQKHKKHKKNARKMALGFFVGTLVGILSGVLFTVLFKLVKLMIRGRGKDPGPSIFSPLIKKAEDLSFLEDEEGVSALEIIGRGGCGEVYRAELPRSNGKMLAIKKINQPLKETAELSKEDTKSLNKIMRQIRSEIRTVGHIRHRNLVPLLAHVPRPDCHFLVYEFMKNGSLQDILHQYSQGTRELDWLTRHNIALGVASGLEYLHMNHNPRIIHRDLKPANILIGDDMEAKITDFGLAKAMPNVDTHVSTSNVAGTVGYIAPEYHQTLKFTDKCDVYSFGVVLGVLVIGKLPSDDFFQHTSEMSLVRWMRNVMTSKDPNIAIDPKLIGNGYEDQMLLVLKIACFCTLDDPKQRPNSKDTRCMLSQIVH